MTVTLYGTANTAAGNGRRRLDDLLFAVSPSTLLQVDVLKASHYARKPSQTLILKCSG
jgi:hypothetical protein